MTEATILRETSATGVATLTLNRPRLHNAFDDVLINDLTAELKSLELDSKVRVVVLTATGKSFSAGADLNWMRRMADYSHEQNRDDARKLAGLMAVLNNLGKPTVARIQGAAFGGGVGLVACCDMVIAADTATFCLSEVKLGLIPAVISPYVVNAIGERQARRYFLSAERFNAQEAWRIGLVHEVVSVGDLDARVDRLLKVLAGNGPEAMVAAKDLAQSVSRGPLDSALQEDTAQRIAQVRAGNEAKEGLSAFLEKRKPAWSEDV